MFRWLLVKFFGYRYHYRIKLIMLDNRRNNLGDVHITACLERKSDIQRHHWLKSKCLTNDMPRSFTTRMHNGYVNLEPICYLGFFK